jgi:hypothetical protein
MNPEPVMCRGCLEDIIPSLENPSLICPKCGTENRPPPSPQESQPPRNLQVEGSPTSRHTEYSVVPFVAEIKLGSSANDAADQLEMLIQTKALEGWEYVRLESVETRIEGNNGCFGIGATPPRVTAFKMAVFRK